MTRFFLFALALITGSGCRPTADSQGEKSQIESTSNCSFRDELFSNGQEVTAYLNPTETFETGCRSEKRRCENGILSGSYSYASCNVGAPAACLFDGKTIEHGDSVDAFLNSTVAAGSTCVVQSRVCENGALSGSYAYANCNVDAPASCLFNGVTIPSGLWVPAFHASSVPFGQSCAMENRTCVNGILQGSFAFPSCVPNAPASCMFNGTALAHMERAVAYSSSTVPYGSTCESQEIICDNGRLSGMYRYGTCEPGVAASCRLISDSATGAFQSVAHGQTATTYPWGYSVNADGCRPETKTCENGSWVGGTYSPDVYASCKYQCPTGSIYDNGTGLCKVTPLEIDRPQRVGHNVYASSGEAQQFCREQSVPSDYIYMNFSHTQMACGGAMAVFHPAAWKTYTCSNANCVEAGSGAVFCIDQLKCHYRKANAPL